MPVLATYANRCTVLQHYHQTRPSSLPRGTDTVLLFFAMIPTVGFFSVVFGVLRPLPPPFYGGVIFSWASIILRTSCSRLAPASLSSSSTAPVTLLASSIFFWHAL